MSISINPNRTTTPPELFGGALDNDDASPTTSSKISDKDEGEPEEEVEEDDEFDSKGRPRSRSDSSESHFVLEKTRRNSGFGSKDPLFQAVYLHDGSMTTEQIKTYKSKFCSDDVHKNNSKDRNQPQEKNRVFWTSSFLNIFLFSSN
eukprot:jgi/Psemu1/30216/gm1.30216_g